MTLRSFIRTNSFKKSALGLRNRAHLFRNSFQELSSSSKSSFASVAEFGAGLGYVEDEMLPASMQPSEFLFQHIDDPCTVSIIGAPMIHGQPFVGTNFGPTLLREAGLHQNLTKLGWRIEDMQDIDFKNLISSNDQPGNHIHDMSNAKNSLFVGKGCEILADMVEQKATENKFPLILGGDHSVAMGSLAGVLSARPNTGVLWIDAHADLNTPDTSETGNMHGMPLGMLIEEMGVDHSKFPGCEWLAKDGAPRLKPDSLVYIGLRDVDDEERKAIRELGIMAFTMFDIDRYGIGKVMDMSIHHLLKNDRYRPLHLSYDIDAVDPSLAPATGTSVLGGLSFREAHYVAEAAVATGLLASADLVELNPTLTDGRGATETADIGLHLLSSMMGKNII